MFGASQLERANQGNSKFLTSPEAELRAWLMRLSLAVSSKCPRTSAALCPRRLRPSLALGLDSLWPSTVLSLA